MWEAPPGRVDRGSRGRDDRGRGDYQLDVPDFEDRYEDERLVERGRTWDDDDRRDDRYDDNRESWFVRNGHTRLDIPAGHYPPPGQCRVWQPGKPPGHQPPPGDCTRLQYDVPAGAWLIGHPADEPGHVEIAVYDQPAIMTPKLERVRDTLPRPPRRPVVVGEFDISSGVLGRVLTEPRPFFERD